MKAPNPPPGESDRLAVLHALGILDTPADERFDRLTRLAKRLFNVPIALVSLVDSDRQWFKSRQGLEAAETDRKISFCGHAISEEQPLIVNDTFQDQRFHDNPLVVAGPKIRFYAGMPIQVAGGHKVGTLCVIDRTPRGFDADDLSALKDLTALVERELEAHQMAMTDDLTSLLNRRGFLIQAESVLELCSRLAKPATMLYCDLNGFKKINDSFGHAEGDRVLQNFGRQLKLTFRTSDICGRLGGDEFAILQPATEKASTENQVQRLRQALQHQQSENNNHPIGFSHGVLQCEVGERRNVESFLEEVDTLMYAMKRDNRAGWSPSVR